MFKCPTFMQNDCHCMRFSDQIKAESTKKKIKTFGEFFLQCDHKDLHELFFFLLVPEEDEFRKICNFYFGKTKDL